MNQTYLKEYRPLVNMFGSAWILGNYPCEIKLEDVWPAWILGIFGKLFTVC